MKNETTIFRRLLSKKSEENKDKKKSLNFVDSSSRFIIVEMLLTNIDIDFRVGIDIDLDLVIDLSFFIKSIELLTNLC